MEWVRLHSESVTGRQGYAAGYKKDIELELLDPTGVVIEKWILQGTMLTNVGFGDLDYSSSDIADISATLRFDRAIHVFQYNNKKIFNPTVRWGFLCLFIYKISNMENPNEYEEDDYEWFPDQSF